MNIKNFGHRFNKNSHLPWWIFFLLGIICFVLINLVLRTLVMGNAPTTSDADAFFLLDLIGIWLMIFLWLTGIAVLTRRFFFQR